VFGLMSSRSDLLSASLVEDLFVLPDNFFDAFFGLLFDAFLGFNHGCLF